MKRSGFTMIELIFVIVILGILAAVAIPRLTATRDDANIAKVGINTATLILDMAAKYTARGTWAGTVSDLTHVPITTVGGTIIPPNTPLSVTTYYISDASGNPCIDVTINQTLADGNITVMGHASPVGNVCPSVISGADHLLKNYQFGGTSMN